MKSQSQHQTSLSSPFKTLVQAKLNMIKPNIITDLFKLKSLAKTNPKGFSELWIAISLLNNSENDRVKAINYLAQSLRNFKSLSSLTLDLFDFGELSQQDITRLTQGIEDLRSLSDLTICFPEEMNDKLIQSLFSSFKALKIMQSLSLDFSECNQVSDEIFRSFLHVIKDLRRLEQMNLDFSCCDQINAKGLTFFIEKLLKLPLKDLNIVLPEIRNDRWLQRLNLGGQRRNNSLSSLSLDFSYCEKIRQKGVQNLVHLLRKNARSLKNLKLNFGECQGFTENVLRELYCFIKELKGLSSLELRLNSSPDADQAVILCLFESLAELKELKKLSLTLSEIYKIEEKEMYQLGMFCRELKSLEILSLELSNWEDVSDQELQNLSYCLRELNSLKTLMINFEKNGRVTQQGFNSLFERLKDLPNLSSVSFNNDECKIVDGVSVNVSLVEC